MARRGVVEAPATQRVKSAHGLTRRGVEAHVTAVERFEEVPEDPAESFSQRFSDLKGGN